jgi:predicted transcriptional regulator of viral defense system
MKFEELLSIVEDEPVFETSLLLSGDVDPVDVRRQLSRWAGNGRLYRLRRGLYALAPPYRKVKAHPFVVANRMVRPSYVSLQSALAIHGLILESVPVTTSITTGRPGEFSTPLGTFVFRHVRTPLFQGFREFEMDTLQPAFVATPEKALLDLLYLEKGSDSEAYLGELRLEIDDGFDLEELERFSRIFRSGKVRRAVAGVIDRAGENAREVDVL